MEPFKRHPYFEGNEAGFLGAANFSVDVPLPPVAPKLLPFPLCREVFTSYRPTALELLKTQLLGEFDEGIHVDLIGPDVFTNSNSTTNNESTSFSALHPDDVQLLVGVVPNIDSIATSVNPKKPPTPRATVNNKPVAKPDTTVLSPALKAVESIRKSFQIPSSIVHPTKQHLKPKRHGETGKPKSNDSLAKTPSDEDTLATIYHHVRDYIVETRQRPTTPTDTSYVIFIPPVDNNATSSSPGPSESTAYLVPLNGTKEIYQKATAKLGSDGRCRKDPVIIKPRGLTIEESKEVAAMATVFNQKEKHIPRVPSNINDSENKTHQLPSKKASTPPVSRPIQGSKKKQTEAKASRRRSRSSSSNGSSSGGNSHSGSSDDDSGSGSRSSEGSSESESDSDSSSRSRQQRSNKSSARRQPDAVKE